MRTKRGQDAEQTFLCMKWRKGKERINAEENPFLILLILMISISYDNEIPPLKILRSYDFERRVEKG